MTQCAHSFLRILSSLVEQNNPETNALLEAVRFGFFFASLSQKQYSILQLLIDTKTENIHVIGRYVEESNLRLRMFEFLLKSDSERLKKELLDSQMIQRVV